jgi:hypothetical protein
MEGNMYYWRGVVGLSLKKTAHVVYNFMSSLLQLDDVESLDAAPRGTMFPPSEPTPKRLNTSIARSSDHCRNCWTCVDNDQGGIFRTHDKRNIEYFCETVTFFKQSNFWARD